MVKCDDDTQNNTNGSAGCMDTQQEHWIWDCSCSFRVMEGSSAKLTAPWAPWRALQALASSSKLQLALQDTISFADDGTNHPSKQTGKLLTRESILTLTRTSISYSPVSLISAHACTSYFKVDWVTEMSLLRPFRNKQLQARRHPVLAHVVSCTEWKRTAKVSYNLNVWSITAGYDEHQNEKT